MIYPGITIDIEKIAFGMYVMIKEHPDGDCLRFGMFPTIIMECLEKALSARIPDGYLDKESLTEVDGKEIKREIEHLVCCRILALATAEGFCVV